MKSDLKEYNVMFDVNFCFIVTVQAKNTEDAKELACQLVDEKCEVLDCYTQEAKITHQSGDIQFTEISDDHWNILESC